MPYLCLTCAFGFKRLFKGEYRPRAKEAPRKNQTLRNSPLARFFCADCRSCDTASTSFTTWARERSPTLSPAPPVFNRHMPAVDLLLYRLFKMVPVVHTDAVGNGKVADSRAARSLTMEERPYGVGQYLPVKPMSLNAGLSFSSGQTTFDQSASGQARIATFTARRSSSLVAPPAACTAAPCPTMVR